MTPTAAYLLLFLAVGIGFIFIHLMAGKFIRPSTPNASKGTIYECGEPTIGSAWIQFDLRFYVIALLFVIFDVEVAFFFPWAEVFGKANALAAVGQPTDAEQYHATAKNAQPLIPDSLRSERAVQTKQLMDFTNADIERLRELESMKNQGQLLLKDDETQEQRKQRVERMAEWEHLNTVETLAVRTQEQGRQLAWLALMEIAVFFGVLLVGFAYLWRRGDLAWVRSLAAERPSGELAALPLAPQTRQPMPPVGAGAHS